MSILRCVQTDMKRYLILDEEEDKEDLSDQDIAAGRCVIIKGSLAETALKQLQALLMRKDGVQKKDSECTLKDQKKILQLIFITYKKEVSFNHIRSSLFFECLPEVIFTEYDRFLCPLNAMQVYLKDKQSTFKELEQFLQAKFYDGSAQPMTEEERQVSNTECDTNHIRKYLTKQKSSDYGSQIALTLAGIGIVGILSAGVFLGIISSPVLISTACAIVAVILAVWIRWVIKSHSAENSTSPPYKPCFQAMTQKLTAFFSLKPITSSNEGSKASIYFSA